MSTYQRLTDHSQTSYVFKTSDTRPVSTSLHSISTIPSIISIIR